MSAPYDDEPEPTEEELRAAAELARAMDGSGDPAPGSDAAFAHALRATRKLEPRLESTKRDEVVSRAIARGSPAATRRTRARWLAVAAAALLALGIPAGLALSGNAYGPRVTVPATYGGRTDALMGSAIDDERRASARMDVMASARANDYFAAWASLEEGAR